jgi:hypothetical protein
VLSSTLRIFTTLLIQRSGAPFWVPVNRSRWIGGNHSDCESIDLVNPAGDCPGDSETTQFEKEHGDGHFVPDLDSNTN